jgi:hypothetical protein
MGFIEHLRNVNTNNYDSLNELHTPQITVTTTDTKSIILGSGLQRRKFLILWVRELPPSSAAAALH